VNDEDSLQKVKLQILISLARSEEAIARIMESVAENHPKNVDMDRLYQTLTAHHHVLLRKIDIILEAPLKRNLIISKPQKPWINIPKKRK
jgi:hypothetical protein